MVNREKHLGKYLIRLLIAVFALSLITWLLYQSWADTLHVVIPDRVYRSAQLPPQNLERAIKTKHIKTILNLRGPNPNAQWYQEELRISKQLGVHHYDLVFASHERPPAERIRQLIYLLQNAPQPILLHCLGGADRSGFASAIALILDKNASLAESERQFSWRHLVTSPHSIGKLVFPYYRAWLFQHSLEHNRQNFLKWIYSKDPFKRSLAKRSG